MTEIELSKLDGGQECIRLYEEIEDILLAGPQISSRDYSEADRKAKPLGTKLRAKIKEVIKINNLDSTKDWKLAPPNQYNGLSLRDW